MRTENAMVSARYVGVEEEDDGALSHLEPHEEAYVLLTSSRCMWRMPSARLWLGPLRLPRVFEEHATAYAVLNERGRDDVLETADEQWACACEWGVDEALEALVRKRKTLDVGMGRWELCL
jgi:hypothetical protein